VKEKEKRKVQGKVKGVEWESTLKNSRSSAEGGEGGRGGGGGGDQLRLSHSQAGGQGTLRTVKINPAAHNVGQKPRVAAV
jgi:hypothetical protein